MPTDLGPDVHPDRSDPTLSYANGMGCQGPQPPPRAIKGAGAAHILAFGKDDIAEAAGAAPLMSIIRVRRRYTGKRAATIFRVAIIDDGHGIDRTNAEGHLKQA